MDRANAKVKMMEKEYYFSPIGIIEVVSSGGRILSVLFVESAQAGAEGSATTRNAVMQIDEYFRGTREKFEVDFSTEGTEFQKKVWSALIKIPYGSTWSYKDLARIVGNTNYSRAVGNANNKNKINIIIPCHRVIGSDGGLTGYAGGLDRKRWLLEHEKNIMAGKYDFS